MSYLREYIPFFLGLLLILATSSCTSTKILTAPDTDTLPSTLTVVPLESSIELTREHSQSIHRAVVSALRNRGFLVALSDQDSPANTTTARIAITSFRRDSVLAGHVNTITGSIDIQTPDQTSLAQVQHTESERGGLLFNSGQVLKGLTSEINNLQEQNFSSWIQRFAESIARALPAPERRSDTSNELDPKIERVSVNLQSAGIQICAVGSSGMQAQLTLPASTVPLLEIGSSGRYCIVLPSYFHPSDLKSAVVELRSNYGLRTSEEVMTNTRIQCEQEHVESTFSGTTLQLRNICKTERGDVDCGTLKDCSQHIFRAYLLGNAGTFRPIAEFGVAGTSIDVDRLSNFSHESLRTFVMKDKKSIQRPIPLRHEKLLEGAPL